MIRTHLVGVFLLIAFTITQGMRDVYLSSTLRAFGFFDTVFIAFAMATVFFMALLRLTRPDDFARIRAQWGLMLAVNLATAGAWLCYFGALKLVEPSVVNTVFSGVSPMAVLGLAMLGIFAADRARAMAVERLIHIGIVAALVFLGWVVLSGRSGYPDVSVISGLGGMLLAGVSGVIITAETIFAKRMNEAGVSATGVLAFRFILIALIGGVAAFGFGETSLPSIPPGEIALMAGILLAVMVAPLFLVQRGLAMTSPLTTGVVTAFAPSVIFAFQAVEGRIPHSGWVLAATLVYAALSVLAVAARTWFVAAKAPAR